MSLPAFVDRLSLSRDCLSRNRTRLTISLPVSAIIRPYRYALSARWRVSVFVFQSALMLIFPVAMAFAAATDLLTFKIPNRISIALVAAFIVVAPFSGLSWSALLVHAATFAVVLAIGRGLAVLATADEHHTGLEGLGHGAQARAGVDVGQRGVLVPGGS